MMLQIPQTGAGIHHQEVIVCQTGGNADGRTAVAGAVGAIDSDRAANPVKREGKPVWHSDTLTACDRPRSLD
jgi:hypothetical protein